MLRQWKMFGHDVEHWWWLMTSKCSESSWPKTNIEFLCLGKHCCLGLDVKMGRKLCFKALEWKTKQDFEQKMRLLVHSTEYSWALIKTGPQECSRPSVVFHLITVEKRNKMIRSNCIHWTEKLTLLCFLSQGMRCSPTSTKSKSLRMEWWLKWRERYAGSF